ncbi:MAG: imidazolonepropionase [Oscillospiraceae bacterium]|jgi:imidazolonepropionase|nr:imidazolonepropionase [Oscillospiraceae bacterium]
MELLLKNIGLLATPRGSSARKGRAQGELDLIPGAMVAADGGIIRYAGPADPSISAGQVIDCGGRLVTPGLVDCHTHLVFGGWRQHEMAQKLNGVPYLDILKAGGGILSTVRATRAASDNELYSRAKKIIGEMLLFGVTTCEAKSGYGLDPETELRQLRVVRRLNEEGPAELAATFMGAHAVPEEYKADREGYIRLVCDKMLPAVAKEGLAEFCDIFCEAGVFSPEEAVRILGRAASLGFKLKAHADEINPIGGAQMAASCGCLSAEHLIAADDEGIAALADKNVIAALLPATSFYLDKPYARARKMIDSGVAVAISTDFNPGSCPGANIQFAMNLGCLRYKLTPAEVLTAVTLNGAAAINRADKIGSLEPGKQADIVVWDATDLDYIFYRFGGNLAASVIKKGRVVSPDRTAFI